MTTKFKVELIGPGGLLDCRTAELADDIDETTEQNVIKEAVQDIVLSGCLAIGDTIKIREVE